MPVVLLVVSNTYFLQQLRFFKNIIIFVLKIKMRLQIS